MWRFPTGRVAAVTVYAVAALVANWPTWPGDPSRYRAGDLSLIAWYLAYTPYALIHHHNIFFTDWLNYPHGVNLAQNQSSPLLGLLFAPLTLLVSPIATLNLLLWLGVVLSASSMFFVLRRFVQWDLAAFVGGALYGFSPYAVAQGVDHLHLSFGPLPPLIFLALYETLRVDGKHPLRWGIALGSLVLAQFFVSSEIAVTSLMIGGIAMVVLAVARPAQVRPALRRGGKALLAAGAILAAGVAYPLWAVLEGPHRYHGAAYPGGVSADLLGTVAPTSIQHFTLGALTTAGSKLLFGNLSENGSYLGIPLLLLLAVLLVRYRSRPWVRFAAVMMLITTVLSLGRHLIVANHKTSIPLPWDLLQRIPFADNVVVVRLALYTSLFAGFLLALGMDEFRLRWRETHRQRVRPTDEQEPESAGVGRRVVRPAAMALLAITTVLSLIPAWPVWTAATDVPSYFTSAAVNRIPAGSVVMISPYPSVGMVGPQVWQAVAKMRFRIIGGYGEFEGPNGSGTPFPQLLQPASVQRFWWTAAAGGPPYPPGHLPQNGTQLGQLECPLDHFLTRYHVGTVVSMSWTRDAVAFNALVTADLGRPSKPNSTTDVWYRVGKLVKQHSQCR